MWLSEGWKLVRGYVVSLEQEMSSWVYSPVHLKTWRLPAATHPLPAQHHLVWLLGRGSVLSGTPGPGNYAGIPQGGPYPSQQLLQQQMLPPCHHMMTSHSIISASYSPFLHLLVADITYPGGLFNTKVCQGYPLPRTWSTDTLPTVPAVMLHMYIHSTHVHTHVHTYIRVKATSNSTKLSPSTFP